MCNPTAIAESPIVLSNWAILKKIWPAAAGSLMEWYEYAVFGYLSTQIAANFYADLPNEFSQIATWASYGVTFLFRPLGGLFFGYLADKRGRKFAMQFTIVLMLVATVGQGCLPTTYCCGQGVGIFGVVALLILRILQGFSAGGELSTAAVWISEMVPPERLGISLSWISVFGAFGSFAIASFLVSMLEIILTPDQMLSWGWRLPFLLSAIPGTIFIIFRNSLEETNGFKDSLKAPDAAAPESSHSEASVEHPNRRPASPISDLWNNHRIAMLTSTLAGAGVGAFWYVVPIYGVSFLQQYTGVPDSSATLASAVSYVVTAVLCPPVGLLIDRIGVGRTFLLAVIVCVATPIPLFYWWTHTPEAAGIVTVYVSLSIVGILQSLTSSIYLWFIELFPIRCRGTGVSVAYNLGVGIFGGLGPVISDAGNLLIDPTGPVSAPAIYVTALSLVSLIAVLLTQWMGSRGTLRVTHIRPVPY